MADEIKSLNDSLIMRSKSLQSNGNSLPFSSYGSGWGASQIFESELAWDTWADSLYGVSAVNNVAKYRQQLGDLSRNSLACAAIRFLGDSIVEAPVQVKKKAGGVSGNKGESKIIPNHKMVALWNKPNDYYDDATLLKGLAFSLVLSSNAYVLKNFDNNGAFPIELWWEPHWTIRPVWPIDGSAFISHYEVNRQGSWYPVSRNNVLHIRDGIHPYNQRLGFSGNDSILPELYGDAEAAAYYATLMGGSGIPGFMVSIDKDMKMDQPKLDALEKMIVRKTTGDRKGQPLIAKGARAYKLGFNPRELDLRESRYMAEDRFCAVQGIPAVVLELGSGQAHSIYNNVKQAMERAWRSYVCPKLTMIEKTLTLQLLDDFEDDYQKAGLYVEHDLSQIQALQEDQDAKATRLSGLFEKGIIMRSEGRSGMGYGDSDESNPEVDRVFYVSGALLKPDEVAPPQPDMGMGGNVDEFGNPIDQFSDPTLFDTAKSFIKGGVGSGPREGEQRGPYNTSGHSEQDLPHGSVVTKSKYGQIEIVKQPNQPVRYLARTKSGENRGTFKYVNSAKDALRQPSNPDSFPSGYLRPDVPWKSLEYSQAILDLLPNGFLNPSVEWTDFATTLGIPRTSMPQVLSEHRGAMVQFLRGRGISHTKEDVLPTSLTATQKEYRPDKVEKAREWTGVQRPILVSKDNYVVDGHHQWAAKFSNPTEAIPIIRLDKEIMPLLLEVSRFPSSGVKDENDKEKFWNKALPNANLFISPNDVQQTIQLLKEYRYDTAVALMEAEAVQLLHKKPNGDSQVL